MLSGLRIDRSLEPGQGTALCSWARHFTLKVPHFTQVHKWVPENSMLGVTLGWNSIPFRKGGGVNTPSVFMLQTGNASIMHPRFYSLAFNS